MKAVVQRVRRSAVSIGGRTVAETGQGLFVFVALREGDTIDDARYLAAKVARLRVFEDEAGRMNLSVSEVGGSIAVVSEFTLHGDTRRGNRPSFSESMPVDAARAFWPEVEAVFGETGVPCVFGLFQAMMDCEIVNDGPVTLIIDSGDRERSRR